MALTKLQVITVCTAIALLSSSMEVAFSSSRQRSLSAELIAIAEDSLNAQYQTLVSGDVEASLKARPLAHLYRATIANQLNSQVAIRAELKKVKMSYKSFRTRLVLRDIQVDGDKAQLKATEVTSMDMDTPPGGPKVTKFSDPHVFDFINEGGEWHLVNDVIVRPAPVVEKQQADLPAAPPAKDLAEAKALKHYNHAVSTRAATRMFGSYDRVASVAYAKQYALTYNSAFKHFNNDCTNFVSQSLNAGGWEMVTGYYTNQDVWWYACALPGGYVCNASYTWGAAYNFRQFLNTSPGNRTVAAQQLSNLFTGDIIFADWDGPSGHHPDGRVDHVMFVTGKDTDGNLYISQHTNDRLDRPMAQVILQETEAQFYGFKVKDSY